MDNKILIVDDDPRMVRLVSEVLKAVGFEVLAAVRGESAINMIALERPDLVLLDIRLEHSMDGFEVCQRIREFSEVPVIMLTAKAQEKDLLRGFEVGADDYLTKPFSSKELVARVRAALRRVPHCEGVTNAAFTCGELQINFARHTVKRNCDTIHLTRTEYKLLCQLAQNANRVMSQQDLLTSVWGIEYRDDVDYLRAYIRYLRRKLEKDPANPEYILTSPGVGYILVCPEEDQ
jgi:two-component system KDP operon response regulator KdpE